MPISSWNPTVLTRTHSFGQGGFGKVFHGSYFNQRVAIKEITHELGEESREQIMQEVQFYT